MASHLVREGSGAGVTLEGIRALMASFVAERDWERFHTPRNVALALVGEVGEVAELFQWKGEVSRGAPELGSDGRIRLGEELSDVLVYLVRLADLCDVDLGKACIRKVRINQLKYPAAMTRGRAVKYTELKGSELFKRKRPLTDEEMSSLEEQRGTSRWWAAPIVAAARAAPSLADAAAESTDDAPVPPSPAASEAAAKPGARSGEELSDPGFWAGLVVGMVLAWLAVYGGAPLLDAVRSLAWGVA